jgi:hypothetical protein
MTVKDLIEQLKGYPGDMRILTLGYEGGLDDIDIAWENVIFNTNTTDAWYLGKHDYARMIDGNIDGTECVIIGRSK